MRALPKELIEAMIDFHVTIDEDWAPDFVSQKMVNFLRMMQTKASVFLTHHTSVFASNNDLDDLVSQGWHPDFRFESMQGTTLNEIFSYFNNFSIKSNLIRSHGNLISTNLLASLSAEWGMLVDSSTLLPRATNIETTNFWHSGAEIKLIPYIWEDSHEMQHNRPIFSIKDPFWKSVKGIAILDFHPIHVYIDALTLDSYNHLKRTLGPIQSWKKEQVDDFLGYDGLYYHGPISEFFLQSLEFKAKFFGTSVIN